MFHISDLKKYSRCPRLYCRDLQAPRREYQPFVRLDEEVTDLAARKLGIQECWKGHRGDDAGLALEAMESNDWLEKARFEYHGLRIKVPFLHRAGDVWDLYFLFVGLYPRADDMQFYCDTVWVLEGNGIRLGKIRMLHLNSAYVRGKELEPEKLFLITECFYNGNNNPTMPLEEAIRKRMRDPDQLIHEMNQLNPDVLPDPVRTRKCSGRSRCRYYEECFPEEAGQADNSILTLIASGRRYAMQAQGKKRLRDADPEQIEGSRMQYAEIRADLEGGLHVDRLALHAWLGHISYPISFLDFEWERYAIPPYEGMKPYDVMPFEYSLHVLQKDGTMHHKVYLNVKDDRRDMAENLIHDIPQTGTVIAYNAEGAEKIRIREFADLFPEYQKPLMSIHDRMEDLQVPFESGVVYDVRMRGQWSLKVIMNMMNDRSYKDLDINQGMEAVFEWRHLDRKDPDTDLEKIAENLRKYCGMDSYSMTVVYAWLKKIDSEPLV
jgi:hypothetical protein